MNSALNWQSLEGLHQRFVANLDVLQAHNAPLSERLGALSPARPFYIAAAGDTIYLGRPGVSGMETVPDPLPPATARNMAATLFPGAR